MIFIFFQTDVQDFKISPRNNRDMNYDWYYKPNFLKPSTCINNFTHVFPLPYQLGKFIYSLTNPHSTHVETCT